jgi:hypothetical protein
MIQDEMTKRMAGDFDEIPGHQGSGSKKDFDEIPNQIPSQVPCLFLQNPPEKLPVQ